MKYLTNNQVLYGTVKTSTDKLILGRVRKVQKQLDRPLQYDDVLFDFDREFKVQSDVIYESIIKDNSAERVGYPTQKPVALYERIIAASSNEGDVVLDPFCGCATTLAAAENLGREWIGIDLWTGAAEDLQARIDAPVHARYEPPIRTDADTDSAVPDLPSINRIQGSTLRWMRLSHADMRAALYEAQGGVCAGCGRRVEVEFMELDHILPRADAAANTIDNRVMLCSSCNRRKSNILTMSGLARANRAAGWTQDAKDASMAADRARLHADSVKAVGRAAYSSRLV